jgi:futalosine hydrolase
MNIYIIAATQPELGSILDFCTAQFQKLNPFSFKIGNNNVHLQVHGVGVPQAMYNIQKYCLQQPQLIIQVGIAGSFNRELNLGNVYVVGVDRFADIGVQDNELFIDAFEMDLIDKNETPFSNGNLFNTENPYPSFFAGLQHLNAITVNTVTGNLKTIEMLQVKYKPTLESMEGAALHYVCLKEKIPFVQIRAISNYVTVRNKADWKIKEAIENVSEYVIHYLKTL